MNRFIPAVAVAIAFVGPASAQGTYPTPGAAGGKVAADGAVLRGSGFTVRRVRRGVYAITLSPGVFPTGCAAVTVAPQNTLVPIVYQNRCGADVVVKFYAENSPDKEDVEFSFTAIVD